MTSADAIVVERSTEFSSQPGTPAAPKLAGGRTTRWRGPTTRPTASPHRRGNPRLRSRGDGIRTWRARIRPAGHPPVKEHEEEEGGRGGLGEVERGWRDGGWRPSPPPESGGGGRSSCAAMTATPHRPRRSGRGRPGANDWPRRRLPSKPRGLPAARSGGGAAAGARGTAAAAPRVGQKIWTDMDRYGPPFCCPFF